MRSLRSNFLHDNNSAVFALATHDPTVAPCDDLYTGRQEGFQSKNNVCHGEITSRRINDDVPLLSVTFDS